MTNLVNISDKEIRKVVRKEIDFIPGAWVDFWDDVTVGTITKAQTFKDKSNMENGIDFILNQIADWNLADSNEEKIPITQEGINMLPSKIFTWIGNMSVEILNPEEVEDNKKK